VKLKYKNFRSKTYNCLCIIVVHSKTYHWVPKQWNWWNIGKDIDNCVSPPSTFTGHHPAPTQLYKVTCRKKCIPQFDCTHCLGMFHKVQSTTLASQTLSVVEVERVQICQVLAPRLLRSVQFWRGFNNCMISRLFRGWLCCNGSGVIVG